MEVPNVNPCHDKCHIFKVLSLQDYSICGIIDSILIRILKGRWIPLNRLLDEASIMLLCAGAGVFAMQTITPVLALLLAIGLVCTLHYFSKASTLLYSIVVFSICCLFCPPFFCAMPLLCYHALWSGKWWLILPSAGALFQLHMFTPIQLLLIASGFCTAGLLYHRTTALEQVTDLLHETRDHATEQQLLLKAKNQALIAAQNYEINLAMLKERNRIAREIHDNVGHLLTRSILQVGALQILTSEPTQSDQLEQLIQTLNQAMTSIRSSVHDLHDQSVSLEPAIRECLRTLSPSFQVQLEYDLSDAELTSPIKHCLLGIVKESSSNIAKHSNGNAVRVVLREHPAFYQLIVTDNGTGAKLIRETGIGMATMKERAESVGGLIRFTASATGFRVFLSIPKRTTSLRKDASS